MLLQTSKSSHVVLMVSFQCIASQPHIDKRKHSLFKSVKLKISCIMWTYWLIELVFNFPSIIKPWNERSEWSNHSFISHLYAHLIFSHDTGALHICTSLSASSLNEQAAYRQFDHKRLDTLCLCVTGFKITENYMCWGVPKYTLFVRFHVWRH